LAILECRNFAAFSFGAFSNLYLKCTLQGKVKVPSDFSHVNRIVYYHLTRTRLLVGQ